MLQQLILLAAGLSLAGLVDGHGMIATPKPRQPGQAFATACGQQDYEVLLNDPSARFQPLMLKESLRSRFSYGNIQGEAQNQNGFTPTADCRLYLCKGLLVC
jgi:hypothetical protein